MIQNIEKLLRKVEAEEKVFRGSKRVKVIKAVDCIKALSKNGYDAQAIKEEIAGLLENYKLLKVKISDKNPDHIDVAISKAVNASDMYMWTEEKYDFLSLFFGITVILILFACAMFKAWPRCLQKSVTYLRYPVYALLGFMFIISVVRLLVYAITQFTHPPGLWIYPNLYAECGVLESFVPMYAWNVPEEPKKEE